MKILISTFTFSLLFSYSLIAQSTYNIDVTSELVSPNHYIIPKTTEHIKIDGIANEENWKNAIYSYLFIDIAGVKKAKV